MIACHTSTLCPAILFAAVQGVMGDSAAELGQQQQQQVVVGGMSAQSLLLCALQLVATVVQHGGSGVRWQ